MPKLDDTFTTSRLQKRITELEAGAEIAKRDIYAVLNEQQQQELESDLAAQRTLKKELRAGTDEEKKAAGWKTIREVRIEVLKRALALAATNELATWEKKILHSEARGARIYMDAFIAAISDGQTTHAAHTCANNALVRAGLQRLDRPVVTAKATRDKEILAMEERIRQRARSSMTPYELEQLQMREELETARASRGKSRKG